MNKLIGVALVGCAISLSACGSEDPHPATETLETVEENVATPQPMVVEIGDKSLETDQAIWDKYEQLKEEKALLGDPVTGAVPGGKGSLRMNFDRGAIYWTPEGGAFIVRGEILKAYDDAEGANGYFGLPISDEEKDGDRSVSRFEGGEIAFHNKTIKILRKAAEG